MTVFTEHALMQDLHRAGGKIILLVLDGLRGLPMERGDQTELEAADTSNLDRLAAEGITSGCGNGNYCPEAPVTRAQMAVFLVRTFGL